MVNQTIPDPDVVVISTSAYQLLLAFYPARFRREYGTHMAQVFRDCCLKTHSQSGTSGMAALWAITLFDWFKTVIEEQLNRGTDMTQSKFIRLSGWGLMLGAVLLFLAFSASDASTIRSLIYRWLGPPTTPERYEIYDAISHQLGGWFLLGASLLSLVGATGLRLRYGKQSGALGNGSLMISVFGGGLALTAMLVGALTPWDGWFVMLWGFTLLFAGLAVFGIAAVQTNTLSRWNALPIVAAAGFPLFMIISLVSLLFREIAWQPADWVMNLIMVMTIGSMIVLGYALQSDSPLKELAA